MAPLLHATATFFWLLRAESLPETSYIGSQPSPSSTSVLLKDYQR